MCSCCGSCDVASAMAPQHHPLAPLSALHLLRSYQHLLAQSPSLPHVPGEQSRPSFHQLGHSDIMIPSLEAPRAPYCPPTFPLLPLVHDMKTTVAPKLLLPRENHWTPPGLLPSRPIGSSKRPRGEKRPIPEEQKDEKYFERRKRNNQAAKKSRDARKIREDQVAFRAAVLEHENAMLRGAAPNSEGGSAESAASANATEEATGNVTMALHSS